MTGFSDETLRGWVNNVKELTVRDLAGDLLAERAAHRVCDRMLTDSLASIRHEVRIATLVEAARLECTRCRLGCETSMGQSGVVHLCDEGHLHSCAADQITMRIALEWPW